ncbi:MAG: secretin N-terminal domain-containing protein [Candidatus Omnitrophota bacterium]
MRKIHKSRMNVLCRTLCLTAILWACTVAYAQELDQELIEAPIPIKSKNVQDALEKRLERKITLDVRDMNIIDVIKFLALKGEFNVVTSRAVGGRITLYLQSVSIEDVLDIILISNGLAYTLQNEIIFVMSEAEYQEMYGRKFNDRSQVSIVHLDYAKPSYALATLDNIKSNLGKIIIDEDTGSVVMIDTPEAIARMKEAIIQIEKPLETYIYNLQYAKADVVAEKLRSRIDANAVGSVVADERSNQLIVRAFPGRRKDVDELVKSLDVKTKEVMIEARVLQLTFKPQFDAGVDWNLDFRYSADDEIKKVSFNNAFLDESNLSTSDNLYSMFSKVAVGNFTQDAFQMSLRALKQISDTRILSNPKLLVTNNEEAKIHIGDTVPYIISTTSGTGDNAITSEDVRFVDVGLKLNVTPTINDDGYVTMRLLPEISTVVARISSQGGGIPQVNKTLVETTVMVKDGNTVILGGLKKADKSGIKKGIPFLMDIPFVGNLFGSKSDTITNTEIVIFITPHIVQATEPYDEWRGSIKPMKDYRQKTIDLRK